MSEWLDLKSSYPFIILTMKFSILKKIIEYFFVLFIFNCCSQVLHILLRRYHLLGWRHAVSGLRLWYSPYPRQHLPGDPHDYLDWTLCHSGQLHQGFIHWPSWEPDHPTEYHAGYRVQSYSARSDLHWRQLLRLDARRPLLRDRHLHQRDYQLMERARARGRHPPD